METLESAPATGETVRTEPEVRRGPTSKSPSALEFALAWNSPEVNTRADVIAKLKSQGFEMSYSALVNRAKSYTDPGRNGGPIKLKELKQGQRGRRVNAAEINEALAQAATQASVQENGESNENAA